MHLHIKEDTYIKQIWFYFTFGKNLRNGSKKICVEEGEKVRWREEKLDS